MGEKELFPELDTDLLAPQPLPQSTDRLFSADQAGWNYASLHRGFHPWGLYAAGYKEAADLLVQQIEARSGGGQDTLVYPIVFLYRQYLELTIKDLIRDATALQKVYGDFPKTHRIDELWRICHALLLQIFPNESNQVLKDIARLIDEFAAVDPNSMAFRYPEDKDGNPSITAISYIDLRNVRDVIAKIDIILSGAGSQVYEYLQMKREMMREFETFY